MQESTTRRTVGALVAALGLALAVGIPAGSQAQPVDQTPAKKNCRMPKGGIIKDGETGTQDGITYKCNDGIGCQVEGGKVTDKCSHMEPLVRWPGRFTGKLHVTTVKLRAAKFR